MALLAPHQVLIRNLKGEIQEHSRVYMPREKALEQLRRVSGKDFGLDIAAWQRWVSENKEMFYGFDPYGDE